MEEASNAGAPAPEKLGAGSWLHNPMTGELAKVIVGPAETDGRRIETDLWLQPEAAVAGPHLHESLIERFEVLEGSVGFQLGEDERAVAAGEARVEVPVRTVHDWWNAGDGVSHVRVEVEAAPDASGRPAERFSEMIETLWSLGALGDVNAKGMPYPLWLAAIGSEFRDVLRFMRPPAFLQAAIFGPLAALARSTGRDPMADELHGPQAPCAIPEPSEERFRELLARPAGN